MRLLELFEQAGKTAAVAFGRMNPPTIGHQKVVAAILKQKADAHFLFVSQTHKPTGKNKTRLENPLPFDVKLGFIQQAFPNIDIGDTSVGTAIGVLQNLEKQGFENVIFVCGSDRVAAFTELFNNQNGVDYNLKSIKIESSGARDPDAEGAEGMSASKMRAAAIVNDFESFKTGLPAGLQSDADEVFSAVRQGLEPWLEQGMAEDITEAVGGNYLYHATSAGGLKGMLSSGSIRSATGPQAATSAQTKLPTVSVTRDWGYASGLTGGDMMGGIGRDAILVLDRNAIESNFKTLGTSQSTNIKGLAFNPYLKKDGQARSQNTDAMARNIAKAKAKNAEPTAKAGGEFEEAVVVPKGSLPLKGTMIGFWINPKSELVQDPSIMNDPRRLDMPRPNQFVKAAQPQGVAEAYPKQQAARYNPNGTTYKGSANKMPTLDPNDPAHNADRYGAAYDEPYEMDFDKEDLKRAIAKGMSDLSDREKQILKLRFWEDMTYEEVASELGVTRERIRQIEARALRQLKHPTRSDRLRPFVHPEIKG